MIPFIIMGIMSAAGAIQKKNAANDALADYARTTAQMDTANMKVAMDNIGRMNVERAGMYRAASSALNSVQLGKKIYKGTVQAAQAATDTVGASAQAALADADRAASEATASVQYNVGVQEHADTQRRSDIYNSTTQAFKAHTVPNPESSGAMAVDLAGAFLSGYLGSGGGLETKPTIPEAPPKRYNYGANIPTKRG